VADQEGILGFLAFAGFVLENQPIRVNCRELLRRHGKNMDTIGNLITIIRNGYMAHRLEVTAPYARQSESVCRLLAETGYLAGVSLGKKSFKKSEFKILKLDLKYQNGQPILSNITRISKPGRRLHTSYKKLPKPLGGYGLVILTTNKGLMIDKNARKEKIGGEPLLSVW